MKVEWDDQEAWRKCWIFATLKLRGRPGASALWDCFGERIFNKAANLSPKQSHNTLDNHLDPVSRATSKWRTATPLLAAAEADALGTEWSLHWNLSIPVACSKSSCQQYKSKQVYEVELLTRTAFIFPSIAKEPVSSSKQFMWRKCSEWLHRPTVLTPLQRAPQASLEASLSIMYRRVLVCQRPWRIPHRPLFHDPLHVKERASGWRFGGGNWCPTFLASDIALAVPVRSFRRYSNLYQEGLYLFLRNPLFLFSIGLPLCVSVKLLLKYVLLTETNSG